MRTLDHEVINAGEFLRALLTAAPPELALELEGMMSDALAAVLVPYAVKVRGAFSGLRPPRWVIPGRAHEGVLSALCLHADSLRLIYLVLRSADHRLTWFESPHFGEDLTVFLHDGCPEELVEGLVERGFMRLCESERS